MSQLHWMWFMNWWWKIIIFLIKLVESGAPCENGWFVKLESFLSEFESDFISLSFVSLSIHWMWGENHWNFPAWNYESNIQAELLNCRDYPYIFVNVQSLQFLQSISFIFAIKRFYSLCETKGEKKLKFVNNFVLKDDILIDKIIN